jgi:hypothetical protein
MSVLGITAVSWLPLTNDVVEAVPFHTTTELLLKFLPFTVRTKPAPPTVALFGEIEVIDGVDGHEQERPGSKTSANAPKRGNLFVSAILVTIGVPSDFGLRADRKRRADNSRSCISAVRHYDCVGGRGRYRSRLRDAVLIRLSAVICAC